MLALLLLLRAAAATTDDVVVQRGAVDHATVAALAADIAGQPAAKGWMAVPGAVAALLGDAGAVKAPYRVAAGAVEAHRDTEDGAAVDGDVSVLYVGADAGATFVLVDAATGAETRVPVEAGTLIRWRNGRFSHRVDAEDQRRALLGPAAPKAGGGLRAVGNAQADDGLQCASGEFAITFGYRPSGAAWGSMNSYPDAEEMCLAPSCFVKTFQLTETIDEAAGLSFAVVDAGSPQSEASVRVYGDDEITWYFCIDSDGSVSRYPSAAPTASARPTPGPSAAPTTTAPSAPSVTPTTSAPSATPTTAAPTTAAPTVVSCASRVAAGSCGGARLLGYAFDDANACANRAAATKTCGAHLQYSPRVDEVGCWCCPEAFEPPGDASSEFALYEIRACDAPTAAPSDAPSFSPTPYPSPSCGFYATLFSATFLPSGAAWASARASVFYGTWDADRDPATNPLIATLAYPFPDLDYLCVAPGCYTLVFEGDADGLRFTIASPVADQTVTVETSDLAFCTDEEGHFDRAPTAAPTATASPSRAPSAGGLALAEPWNCTNGTAAQVLPYGDAYVIAALDGGSGTYRVNRYLDVPSGAQVNAVAMVGGRVVAAVDGRLCAVDGDGSLRCLDGALGEASPDAAAGLFGSYYYAARPGAPASTGAFYWVEDALGDAAAYRGAAPFRVADALFPHGGVHDVAGIVEQPGDDDLILDGILGGAYLVGLGCGFEVLVVRLHEDSGAPEAYAVMTPPSTVAWNGADPQALVTSGFGAAWAFGKGAGTRAFFAENAGLGVFEVLFPLTVPETYWNFDDDEDDDVYVPVVPATSPTPTPRPTAKPTDAPADLTCLAKIVSEGACDPPASNQSSMGLLNAYDTPEECAEAILSGNDATGWSAETEPATNHDFAQICGKRTFIYGDVWWGTICNCCTNSIINTNPTWTHYDIYTYDCDFPEDVVAGSRLDDCPGFEPCEKPPPLVCPGTIEWTPHAINDGAVWAPSSLKVADLDGDCCVDFVVTDCVTEESGASNSVGNRVSTYRNDCAQNFTEILEAYDFCPAGSDIGDIDGDCDLDVVATVKHGIDRGRQQGDVNWYENWEATFVAQRPVSGAPGGVETPNYDHNYPWGVEIVDVDGDGDQDVVVSDWGDGHVQWYENSGGPDITFALHEVGYAASTSYAVVAADVDGDGDVDLLAGSARTYAMTLFENLGDALTWTAHAVATPDTTYGVSVADVDGDDDLDLLSSSHEAADDAVCWFSNLGGLAFDRACLAGSAEAFSVAAADLDGDDDMDIISGETAWYENDGAEGFSRRFVHATPNGAAVVVADVDGDGDLDIAAVSMGRADFDFEDRDTYECQYLTDLGQAGFAGDCTGFISWFENDCSIATLSPTAGNADGGSGVEVVWRGPSDEAGYNDGVNCQGDPPFASTPFPTLEPTDYRVSDLREYFFPTAAPSVSPSLAPTPYPSPDCAYPSHAFAAEFLPSGADWGPVTASVYWGTWDEERDVDMNPLITQLSHPFPDVDYLCIFTGCYTLVFEIDGVAEGFDSQHLSLDGSDGTETMTINGTQKLALCADADTGEFNHAPTAAPSLSMPPSYGPSQPPSYAPSATPSTYAPSATPSMNFPTVSGDYCAAVAFPAMACSQSLEFLGFDFVDANACAHGASRERKCAGRIHYSATRNDEYGCWCCDSDALYVSNDDFDVYDVVLCGDPSAAPSSMPLAAPTAAPTSTPSAPPSFLPTPYPSPDCAYPSHTFAAEFLPSGKDWAQVTASVYWGTWDEERDVDMNPLITQLSHPFPDVDYLCIFTGCYTLVFEIDGVAEGLSFTISSESDSQHLSLDGSDGTETMTINGTQKLALCADADTGEFNHAPTATPTLSLVPSYGPSSPPSYAPSPTPSTYAPSAAPSSRPTESFPPSAGPTASAAPTAPVCAHLAYPETACPGDAALLGFYGSKNACARAAAGEASCGGFIMFAAGSACYCCAVDAFAPSAAPTYPIPSPNPTPLTLAWSTRPHNCSATGAMLRPHKVFAGGLYTVVVGAPDAVAYDVPAGLSVADVDGAAAVHFEGETYPLMAIFGGSVSKLCPFDAQNVTCFPGALAAPVGNNAAPSVAAVVGTSYHYAYRPGAPNADGVFYRATGIYGLAPTLDVASDAFAVSSALFDGAVGDVAALVEDGDDLIVDGVARAYLVGLGCAYEAFVVRLDAAGAPEAYAVVASAVDWNGGPPGAASPCFSAAFTVDGDRAVFQSDDGDGLFELATPLVVDDACWNTGSGGHVACAGATVVRRAAAGPAAGDGFACADAASNLPTTNNPTAAPSTATPTTLTPSPPPTRAPSSPPTPGQGLDIVTEVVPFDCGAHSNPIQVLKFALADTKHYVMELNLDTGEYEELYNFEVAKVNGYATVNAAAVFDAGNNSFYPFANFNDELCVFSANARTCVGDLKVSSASSGAIVGDTYYYACATCGAENIGPQWIYTVFSIGQPAPVFSERSDLILRLRRELWYEASSKGNIYDWASLVEGGAELVDDDDASGKYLIGMNPKVTKIVVVKIDEATGQAGSYAVIPVETDWNGQTPVSGWSRRNGGSSPFGAAFTYQTDDYDRVFFTSNDAWGLFELELPFRGRTRERNSQLQRLLSRPFSTRFG
ncbi:hypothetical protein AURANDRAFT_61437 [Aureococcus anophagefferens]|uniref:Uncharacterized protein n=1 Tax=Aureococcus anophagefferens TaxID=44056 RepID=F0XYF0_AURAN|nr:hypothetical protein AURANDRAFT_61437 [Aureococcus anophagefferens]EGB12109.1 hypothetical protein AURANDRAFT_61437 [Aureococcus anophagefferens]|eukprot:XP_009033197.1 hypothetical protein AURANDRAFT_61437 [Aureococcus anophagefferens]